MIDRRRAEKLTPQHRALIQKAMVERPLAPLRQPPPPPPRRYGWWLAAGSLAAGLACATFLRG
jgi:hypothetical protein